MNTVINRGPATTFTQQFTYVSHSIPDQVAVVSDEGFLRYGELNTRANQLAWSLIERGVKPEQLIGICLNRKTALYVALLGVMKAGAAYLPIDPELPQARIALMLEDSQCSLVITDENIHLFIRMVDCVGVNELISLHQNNPEIARPNSLAYVTFTSGSTGRPKGVMIEHRALASFLGSMKSLTGITQKDCWLATTSISFDISCVELFLPLISGARSYIAQKNQILDPQGLESLTRAQQITWMQATPSGYSILCELGFQNLSGLSALVGGEPLPFSLASKLINIFPKLINMYGPTETTIWSTYSEVIDTINSPYASIGKPLSKEYFYILSETLQPVQQGEVGELYIGGIGLARGYLNQPDLTAERFIHDSFSFEPGAKLYKTGDFVRCDKSGFIEYIGRIDDQVKIRGFRVELGEILARTLEIDGINNCFVMAREDDHGEHALAIYYVASSDWELSGDEIRRALSNFLPSYMIPSYFFCVEVIPLTFNGKVDKVALLELEPENRV